MEDISFKVFVGSIDFNATEKDVEEAFKPYGEVVHVILLRDKETQKSRGFGFVTFKEKHSVDAAIKGMHRQPILGRPIVVNYAEKKSNSNNAGPNQNNFNPGMQQQQMQSYGGNDQQQQQPNQFYPGYAGQQQQGYAGWNQQGYGNWGPYWQQGYGAAAWGQWWNQQMQGQQQQAQQQGQYGQQQGANPGAAGNFQAYQNFNGMQPSQSFNGNSNTTSNGTNGNAGGGGF